MNIKFYKKITATVFIVSTLMTVNSANAGGRFKAKGTTTNPEGGVTSVKASGAKGQNGGGFMHARGTTTNGQGQAAGGGATAVKGPNGGGVRAGAFTADDSGNVNYQGGAAATGANGSAATTGGFTRSEGGGIKASRSTTATANNGSTYNGNTTYQTGSGVSYTPVCYDANGYEIKCPSN